MSRDRGLDLASTAGVTRVSVHSAGRAVDFATKGAAFAKIGA